MNYGGIVPALEEPGLLVHTSPTQPRPVEPNIAWSCVRITQCGHLKAKKKKKNSRGRKILKIPCVPRMEEPFFLANQQHGKGYCLPRQWPPGAGGSRKGGFEVSPVCCDAG